MAQKDIALQNEVWKPIPGYEGLYEVSSLGRVFSKSINKVLSPHAQRNGYLNVDLYNNRARKKYRIHRLVAITFIPNPKRKEQVDHIDGNILNNCASNLRWNTPKENVNNELAKRHHLEKVSKGVIRIDKNNSVRHYEKLSDVVADGFLASRVSECCNKHYGRVFHKGFAWVFDDETLPRYEDFVARKTGNQLTSREAQWNN